MKNSLHTFVVSLVSVNEMTNERDVLQTFLSSHNLSHLFQNLVEFGIDSLDALKYERDLRGLCEDIGAMEVDAERLELARKSLSSEEEENVKKREPEKLKTTSAKEAIEQAKLAMKARTENVSTSDGQRKLRESLLEKQSGGVGVGGCSGRGWQLFKVVHTCVGAQLGELSLWQVVCRFPLGERARCAVEHPVESLRRLPCARGWSGESDRVRSLPLSLIQMPFAVPAINHRNALGRVVVRKRVVEDVMRVDPPPREVEPEL